jgi:hypothetical protein
MTPEEDRALANGRNRRRRRSHHRPRPGKLDEVKENKAKSRYKRYYQDSGRTLRTDKKNSKNKLVFDRSSE